MPGNRQPVAHAALHSIARINHSLAAAGLLGLFLLFLVPLREPPCRRSFLTGDVLFCVCRSASERLDTLLARPAWLPPDAQRRPQRSAQPQPA